MNNVKQIKVISNALNKKREQYLFEMSKINSNINKKQSLIMKMVSYFNEYISESNFSISKKMPNLIHNIELFLQKIQDVIIKTENEVHELVKGKNEINNKIIKLDEKIDLMEHFNNRIKENEKIKQSKIEQLTIDDISVVKKMRGDYE